MELLQALNDELEENYERATSTKELIVNERDMLQGNAAERIVLLTLSTDVWKSVINSGQLESFQEAAKTVSDAYRDIHQLNTIIEKFNTHGDKVMYNPLLKQTTQQYSRNNLLDIIAELSGETASRINTATTTLQDIIDTECPVCGERFPSRSAMKSHITQKQDPEHEAMEEQIV
ncbi:MAG: C2H2-type zinc finger protein [Candidatus Nanohaloarchaeota archaeon QJJ-5]|nr:C2H2-type zinc finger protein [Candidatus Nanohaloarchaeota archaeon QJJ-5]